MSKSKKQSVTVDDAIALMVNVDCYKNFPLFEMLEAFRDDAEVNYENAKLGGYSAEEIELLRVQMESCRAREILAHNYKKHLLWEINEVINSEIKLVNQESGEPRLTLSSVSSWVAAKYGIAVCAKVAISSEKKKSQVKWEDLTVKIYKDFRIRVFSDNKTGKIQTFRDIGLMGERKNQPNQQGIILIGLSEGMIYPSGSSLDSKTKTAIHRLRLALKKLTGLTDDPFRAFNEAYGYKPRFKLVDDRRNADKRAKEQAEKYGNVSLEHEAYRLSHGDPSDFEREGDDAQRFLDERE